MLSPCVYVFFWIYVSPVIILYLFCWDLLSWSCAITSKYKAFKPINCGRDRRPYTCVELCPWWCNYFWTICKCYWWKCSNCIKDSTRWKSQCWRTISRPVYSRHNNHSGNAKNSRSASIWWRKISVFSGCFQQSQHPRRPWGDCTL